VQLTSRDERRHPAERDPWWGEAWGFDWACADPHGATPEAVLGGFVRLAVYPRRRVAWFWAGVVRTGARYILCRDHDLDPPSNPDVLEIRGGALWMHMICETPLDHWTCAMEAYAVALDDPTDAWHGERGERVGLAFDLEWEDHPGQPAGPSDAGPAVTRYDRRSRVDGVLQLGEETIQLADATGWRHHEWGRLDWSGAPTSTYDAPGDADLGAPLITETPTGDALLLRRLTHDPTGGLGWRTDVVSRHASGA
jgi:hypothetical protein